MFSQVESKSIDIGEKKYYLVTPEGLIFHEIPFEEIHNLTREVWVSSCPCCGGIQGYYYSKNEAKQNSKFCVQCSCTRLFPVKRYKGYYKQNVNFRLLTKGYKEYRGIKYPYMDIHG